MFIVAKKRRSSRRRRIGGGGVRRRRRSNPFGFARVKHHRRRRRNPGGGGFRGTFSGLGSLVLWGGAGAVASRVLPSMLLSSMDSGFTGYGLNGLTAVVGGMLVGKFAGPDAGQKFTAGGIISMVLRAVTDYFGSNLPGLSYYIENSFPLPTSGQGPYLLNPGYSGSPMLSVPPGGPAVALPVSAAAAAANAGAIGSPADEPNRWGKWAA